MQFVNAAVNQRGRCFLALCGGRTGPAMYRVLAEPAFAARVPWHAVHVFWSDERFVVAGLASRATSSPTKRSLLDHVPLLGDHIHPMPTLLPSVGEAAEAYEEELMIHFSGFTPRFELMINGLGEDGHTASLFPHSEVLSEDFQAQPGHPDESAERTPPTPEHDPPRLQQRRKRLVPGLGSGKSPRPGTRRHRPPQRRRVPGFRHPT